jgi:Tfp pilus assembly protein FimT
VEIVAALAIGLILAAIAIPIIFNSLQQYRLNNAVQQAASLLQLTRYTAIRRNANTSLKSTTQAGNTILYIDLDNNSTLTPADPQILLPADLQIANGQPQVPPGTGTGLPTPQDFTTVQAITFDSRGTVNTTNAIFLAIAHRDQARYGARAVTVTKMGQAKTWIAAGNAWQGTN